MELRCDAFRVFRVTEDGVREDPVPQVMRNTLFSVLWDPEKASLLRVDRPRGEDQLELEASRMRLVSQLQQLPDDLKVLGAGNGLKKGKVWSADARVVQWCRDRYFSTSEEALSYGSLLFSENRAIYECTGAGIYEEEGPDGQGLIDADWLVQQDLPVRQVQVRAAWPNTLAKGTLKPCWGLRESSGHSFLFHPTMLKGKHVHIDGDFIMGIRDVAEQREFRSGWTVTQWMSESVRQRLWDRYAIEVLHALEGAFTSTQGALKLLAALPRNGDNEARDLLHLLLHSGLEPSHPWLRTNLKKHVRQPVVGGWRSIAEKDELTETEAVVAMRQLTERWRGKTVSVVLKLEDVSWADIPVVNAYCGGHLLGCVAPELADQVCDKTFEPVDALLSMRGRTVYALLLA